jgi:hypothetical protein
MMRGCNVLPIGGVDLCQQASLFGLRTVVCYCFTDFCNAAVTTTMSRSRSATAFALTLTLFAFIFCLRWH